MDPAFPQSSAFMVMDAAGSASGDTTDVAVASVLGLLLLALLTVPALFVLCALRMRSARRFELLRQWAAADRGPDADFPTRYGAEGYPHGRFFYSALVLTLALILTAGVLADWSDPSVLGLLPCLVVAGLFACSTIRKYAARYGWAVRERVIRARARRRELHRTQIVQAASRAESPKTDLSGMHIHPAVLYAALFDPAVIVTVVFVAARPQDASGLAVVGLLALLLLVLRLPKVVRMRRREQVALDSTASSVASAFPGGAVVHPVRYGLGEPDSPFAGSMLSAWDAGPSRTEALAVDAGYFAGPWDGRGCPEPPARRGTGCGPHRQWSSVTSTLRRPAAAVGGGHRVPVTRGQGHHRGPVRRGRAGDDCLAGTQMPGGAASEPFSTSAGVLTWLAPG
jgi:hypothetical protein